jgi:hypothetical protein
MPNWCNNSVTIRGPKEKIESFQKFLDDNNGKDWFDFFHPCPQELKDVGNVPFNETGNAALIEKYGYSDWYSWSVDNWGTKWNCDAQDWSSDGESITFWFDSAWSPPIALYSFIEQDGEFEVVGDYLEEGMQFIGRYSDGFDDSYEYSDVESLDDIPEEIVEEWDLRTRMEEWEEMLDEDEE